MVIRLLRQSSGMRQLPPYGRTNGALDQNAVALPNIHEMDARRRRDRLRGGTGDRANEKQKSEKRSESSHSLRSPFGLLRQLFTAPSASLVVLLSLRIELKT